MVDCERRTGEINRKIELAGGWFFSEATGGAAALTGRERRASAPQVFHHPLPSHHYIATSLIPNPSATLTMKIGMGSCCQQGTENLPRVRPLTQYFSALLTILACLQFEPILGEVQRNIDHATKMISG